MSTNPMFSNSDEWREMKSSLRELTDGQSEIEGRLDRYDYGSATVFWIRAMVGLLTLAIAAGGLYIAIHH